MLILQFQVTNTDEYELAEVPRFCQWLCDQIYSKINTKLTRNKIESRLEYIKRTNWIHWTSNRNITTTEILNTMYECLVYNPHKNNVWVIEIDNNVRIPHSNTSMSRLIRFINSGDTRIKGTGIFTNIENEYKHKDLNTLWKMYIMDNLRYMPNSIIISR